MLSNVQRFERYVGVDYSGAETPTSSLKGLRVFVATSQRPPAEIHPPPSSRRYWTRREVAQWLVGRLREEMATLVGIDHGFSFPICYFEKYHLPPDWPAFLDDFQEHWPTDQDHMYVDFVRDGLHGKGSARSGDSRWRRVTEVWTRTAKSVFHFDVPGSVAKATHAGLPWLRYIRHQCSDRVHFWPFDGWVVPAGWSVVAEVYPSLWRGAVRDENLTPDQEDARNIAAWLRRADHDRSLSEFLNPALSPSERATAQVEGWILGVK
jgi:hypothetical protein